MSVLDDIYARAKADPQRVAFPEATNEKMLQAAYEAGQEGYILPVLVGEKEKISALAQEKGYSLSAFTVVDIHEEEYKNKVIEAYVHVGHKLKDLKARQSGNTPEVIAYADKVNERLRRKYYKMIRHGKKKDVAVMAAARELACFIWRLMTGHISIA